MKKDFTKERYTLSPQMRDYDKIGIVWLPFLMYFHSPLYKSEALNTDLKGFRITYKNDKIIDFNGIDNDPLCVLIGGSTAFSVGASHDKYSLSSLISSNSNYSCMNFGGRAYGSTQEQLLFLFNHHLLKPIKKVIIFSGINNLILYYLSKQYSREHGSFYFWNSFNEAMNKNFEASIKRKILKSMLQPFYKDKIDYYNVPIRDLVDHILNKKDIEGINYRGIKTIFEDIVDHNSKKDDLMYVLKRDIANWKILSQSMGFELSYVFQPLANWTKKVLSEEENRLFFELDNNPLNTWKILSQNLGDDIYTWYINELKGICDSNGIPFFDMNNILSNENIDGKWIHVDRVHYNDEGNKIIAKILCEKVIY